MAYKTKAEKRGWIRGLFVEIFGRKKTSRKDTISAKNVKKLKKKARKNVKRSKWKAASKKWSKKRK